MAGFLEVRGKKAPTIILCHSKGNSHKLDILEKLAKFLLDNNLNVFRFDFRGHGESQKAPLSYGWYERSDVIGAANYL